MEIKGQHESSDVTAQAIQAPNSNENATVFKHPLSQKLKRSKPLMIVEFWKRISNFLLHDYVQSEREELDRWSSVGVSFYEN